MGDRDDDDLMSSTDLPEEGSTFDLLDGALDESPSEPEASPRLVLPSAHPSPAHPPPPEDPAETHPAEGEAPAPRRRSYSFIRDADARQERRRAARFELRLPVSLHLKHGVRRCSASSGSIDGLFLRTDAPLPVDTRLDLQVQLLGSHSETLPAKVARLAKGGVGIQLEPDPDTLTFRGAFLEMARNGGLQPPKLDIHIRASKPELAAPHRPAAQAVDLVQAWSDVVGAPDDDALHQRFIHAAMKQDKLGIALERYRARLEEGDDNARRYLDQLGVIMGFYSQRNDAEQEGLWATVLQFKKPLAVGAALLAALVMGQALVSSLASGPGAGPTTEVALPPVEPARDLLDREPDPTPSSGPQPSRLLEPIPLEEAKPTP